MKSTIGVFGLGVMGASLAKNMANKGERVAVYNYTPDLTEKLVSEFAHDNVTAHYELEDFVNQLEKPRKIFLMVTAGSVTDAVIQSLIPLLEKGDLIMDGGNAQFQDSNRRYHQLKELGIDFLSVGVSGGEEGALHGPALMPSGARHAYDQAAPILEKIAAQVDGKPCCSYIGPEGAGHYVKMVHNGIEYGDMQLISEAYHLLKDTLGLEATELHEVFSNWNQGELDSYLIEITADIITKIDPDTKKPLADVILDSAGQKGTGKWTSESALELGVPLSIITESVFARFISAMKEERVAASEVLKGPDPIEFKGDRESFIEAVRQALYASKICSY